MDPVFTIPYTELRSMEILDEMIKKVAKGVAKEKGEKVGSLKDVCSSHIPVSRQQKGFDFIVVREEFLENPRIFKTVQVKGSLNRHQFARHLLVRENDSNRGEYEQ